MKIPTQIATAPAGHRPIKGDDLFAGLPEAVPEGQFLVHNSVRPMHPSGRTVSARGCKRKMNTLNPATVGGSPSWVRTIA